MNYLNTLEIEEPVIALFGSGSSVLDLTDQEFALIKSKAFVITLNYAPVRMDGHLNVWADSKVSEFLTRHYRTHPKRCKWLVRRGKATPELKPNVDCWFDRSKEKENLKGNYTLVWTLQLLRKYFPTKKVLLFGVDMYPESADKAKWYDHYTDYDKTKRGNGYKVQQKLDSCAKQLRQFVPPQNIYNCNPNSGLDHFEKADWRDHLPLNVLQLCCTPLAGAPAHLSNIINKYTNSTSESVLRRPLRPNGTLAKMGWTFSIEGPTDDEFAQLVREADVLHHHRKRYPVKDATKPALMQFHSPPDGYRPGETFAEFNGRKLVIAQYHPRFYTDAKVVPNMIDIWDPMFMPEKKSADRIRIFYSYATHVKGGWADKGSEPTKAVLRQISEKYGEQVEVVFMHKKPHADCMAAKRGAHICIDECMTGSYHLQSLEGCSVGAVTFNNIDALTASYVQRVTGVEGHPFVKASTDELFDALCRFIDNPELLRKTGKAARAWMEQHWNPQVLVKQFMRHYIDVLLHRELISTARQPQVLHETPVVELSASAALNPAEQPVAAAPKPAPAAEVKALQHEAAHRISELYQKYAGEDIYIFGTGPSLHGVDAAQYKDKLCFGINYAFEIMPHIDYHFVHVRETFESLRNVLPAEKMVLPETLVRQWHRDATKLLGPQRVPTDCPGAYIYPLQDPSERALANKTLELTPDANIFTWSTTTHSAIHLAAYMGAKRIFLVGVDYELYPDGRVHFHTKHNPAYSKQEWNTNRKHRQGDQWLAAQLKALNIELVNLSQTVSKTAVA